MTSTTTPACHGYAILEVAGLTPAMVAMDVMTKTADVRIHHYELNDLLGICIVIIGDAASLEQAVAAATGIVDAMTSRCVAQIINRPHPQALAAIESPEEYQPLLEQPAVFYPAAHAAKHAQESDRKMNPQEQFAIGLIETQGFTAVLEAIDTACKAANVQVLGKEKLGGGYIAVLIKGDVAAVEAAVAAGKTRVDALGKLIAAHVISRPSAEILSLLPRL